VRGQYSKGEPRTLLSVSINCKGALPPLVKSADQRTCGEYKFGRSGVGRQCGFSLEGAGSDAVFSAACRAVPIPRKREKGGAEVDKAAGGGGAGAGVS